MRFRGKRRGVQPDAGPLRVDQTSSRRGARGEYIVCVNPSARRRHGLGPFTHLAVAKRSVRVQLKGEPGLHDLVLAVPCRVVDDVNRAADEILLDQTLRAALGVPHGTLPAAGEIAIARLRRGVWQPLRGFLSRFAGRRVLVARVVKAAIPDMEKELCRLPESIFELLGCKPGDRIVVQSAVPAGSTFSLRSLRMTAYEVSQQMMDDRRAHEQDPRTTYDSPEERLGVKPDLPPLFLDLEGRHRLGVRVLQPVYVRRSTWHSLRKQYREAGVLFVLSALAAGGLIPGGVTHGWQSMWIAAGAFLFALVLVWLAVRASVR